MSKKTNALNLRSVKSKDWSLKSFVEDFNYSKVLYQDLYIQDYIKNVLEYHYYESIVHDISIQRRKDVININVFFYSQHPENLVGASKKGKSRLFHKQKKRSARWKFEKKYYNLFFQTQKGLIKYDKYRKYLVDRKIVIKDRKGISSVMMKRPLGYKTRYSRRTLGGHSNYLRYKSKLKNKKKKRQFNNKFLFVFSLRRLLQINLYLLTGCRVNICFKNLINIVNFRLFPKGDERSAAARARSKFVPNKYDSARGLMEVLKIRPRINKLKGINVLYLVHLIITSFIVKSPQLLGIIIGRYLKKNIKSFNFFLNYLSRTLLPLYSFSNLRGLKIQFKGRLGTSLRKRTSVILFGSMPLQTINSNIKYSFTETFTIYGVCGIKIWYHY